jgi:hypothetical protein
MQLAQTHKHTYLKGGFFVMFLFCFAHLTVVVLISKK